MSVDQTERDGGQYTQRQGDEQGERLRLLAERSRLRLQSANVQAIATMLTANDEEACRDLMTLLREHRRQVEAFEDARCRFEKAHDPLDRA